MRKVFTFLLVHLCLLAWADPAPKKLHYKIKVRLDDKSHTLSAYLELVYRNLSPDTLHEIYFHIWPNAYKGRNSELNRQLLENRDPSLHFSKVSERGKMDSLAFTLDGETIKHQFIKNSQEICKINLPIPLKPGDSCSITTPFRVKIPDGKISRLGHIGQAYAITQWYPKPAVYNSDGWNIMPYLDQGEFFSEFATFEVEISLPENYPVAATGTLQTESEIEYLRLKCKEKIVSSERKKKQKDPFPPSSTSYKTIRYYADNVHDFAWFADKRYNVRSSSIELSSGRKIMTYSFFTPKNAGIWANATEYVNSAVAFYSSKVGDYPYDFCTAVDGTISAGGGMEYPMVTIIGNSNSERALENVIVHEVGHNWFYGILASNERKFPWMDEGINTYYDHRYTLEKYPGSRSIPALPILGLNSLKSNDMEYLPWLFCARKNIDQASGEPSADFTALNYGIIVYGKTALLMQYLEYYLGTSVFDSCMKKYYTEFSFNHPTPADIRKVFEDVSGKELNWFFEDFINSKKTIDYSIKSCRKSGNKYSIELQNNGECNPPFMLRGIGASGKSITDIWVEGSSGKFTVTANPEGVTEWIIDPESKLPEIDRKNNRYHVNKTCHKTEPLRFQFANSVEIPGRTQIFYTPVWFWNNYNKSMLGFALYNTSIIQKPIEYLLMPLFSFNPSSFAGEGYLRFNKRARKGNMSRMRVNLSARRYAYGYEEKALNYLRIMPSVDIFLKKKSMRTSPQQRIGFRSIFTNMDASAATQALIKQRKFNYSVTEIGYFTEQNRLLHPWSFNVVLELIHEWKRFNLNNTRTAPHVKLHAEFKQTISYLKTGNGFDIRIFAGTFLTQNQTVLDYRYRLSGQPGFWDYKFDNNYFGRTEGFGFMSQQFVENDGGFKAGTGAGQTWAWLLTTNLKASLPGPIPIRVYLDLGVSRNKAQIAGTNQFVKSVQFNYGTGVMLSIWKNVLEIYFPVANSKYIEDAYIANGIDVKKDGIAAYVKKIRFTFNINKINLNQVLNKIRL